MSNGLNSVAKSDRQQRVDRYMALGVDTLQSLGQADLLNQAYERPWLIEALLEHEREHGVDEQAREWIRKLPLLEPLRPTPPPARLICDACGDVTHKPHGWLCRAMAAIDRWTGMRKDSGGKT